MNVTSNAKKGFDDTMWYKKLGTKCLLVMRLLYIRTYVCNLRIIYIITFNYPYHKASQHVRVLVMVLLEHVCVLTWSITACVCAGYGLLQHVCVLSWSITASGCAIKLLYTTV